MEKNIKSALEKLPGVQTVSEVEIRNNLIEHMVIKTRLLGKLNLKRLEIEDAEELFNFYFQGLSEKSRIFFPPYPLFSPRPKDSEELAGKIKDWKKEDDWIVLELLKNNLLIGICLLKRYKTKRPTSGLAVHEKFQKKGLGILLQTIINEQARLLGLKKLIITLAQNNKASFKVHEKAGFKKTNRLVPHFTYMNGEEIIDRYDIEMIKEFNN